MWRWVASTLSSEDVAVVGAVADITQQCDVKFDESGYTLRATEDYKKGEEVYMSYGSHPNDFLLAECESSICQRCWSALTSASDGFFLDRNESDCIYLDDIVFRDINDHKDELQFYQYYGYGALIL